VKKYSQACWHTSIIPASRRLWQEDYGFQALPGLHSKGEKRKEERERGRGGQERRGKEGEEIKEKEKNTE
jgi:hypothetical protein